MTGRETGDRARFLAPARRGLDGGIAVNPVHVPPPTPAPGAAVPLPGYRNLDPDDLVGTFAAAVRHVDGTCHLPDGPGPGVSDALLDRLAGELGGRSAVTSVEPEARAVGRRLADRGVTVHEATVERRGRGRPGDHGGGRRGGRHRLGRARQPGGRRARRVAAAGGSPVCRAHELSRGYTG